METDYRFSLGRNYMYCYGNNITKDTLSKLDVGVDRLEIHYDPSLVSMSQNRKEYEVPMNETRDLEHENVRLLLHTLQQLTKSIFKLFLY